VAQFTLDADAGGEVLLGSVVRTETVSRERYEESTGKAAPASPWAGDAVRRFLIKTGNRRVDPPDFRWIYAHDIDEISYPPDATVLERREWGTAYGYLRGFETRDDDVVHLQPASLSELDVRLDRVRRLEARIENLESEEISRINQELEQLRRERRALDDEAGNPQTAADLDARQGQLLEAYATQEATLRGLVSERERDLLVVETASGDQLMQPLSGILRVWQPNRMSFVEKLRHYADGVWLFLSQPPREANTEGGVFPAIFGTVLMVLLMSVVVTPLGVIAAVYLHEYARQGPTVRLIRIAVNNLAGVPSIVFGVFGLGFFVYFVGGGLDQLFFRNALPAPTFGTPGLLWASLTLALLTLPVVVVSTEEGLGRIPASLREGSLALGATRAETLYRVILPLAAPSILTGVILAVARAAGEVAPLMLVGVVKLAPSLPIDGNFPFLHLERKFMHLGFHIYDVGFQSPNVEAARPLVYSTALLLTLVIVALNVTAMVLRRRLERANRGLVS
jgi:phosphate transport system permease protein